MNKLIEDQFDTETEGLLREICRGKYSRFEDTTHLIDDEFLDEFIETYICSTPDWE